MSDYRTKTVTLPGGRVVRIVYFSDPASELARAGERTDQAPAPEPTEEHEDGLHVCPSCLGELVYPVSWEERRRSLWRLELRCPDCEWRGGGEFDQLEVEAFDDALNDGTEELLSTLRSMARANMEADVDRLIRAINENRIHPMDF